MIAEVRPPVPGAARRDLDRARRLGRLRCRRASGRPGAARRDRGHAQLGRPDQHPIHLGHDRLPQGRHAEPPQHPEQRVTSSAELSATTERDRVCIPVPFYHCFGMVHGQPGATTHGACMVIPAPAFEPEAPARGPGRSGARRCTAYPTMFIAELGPTRTSTASTCRRLRTGIMAGSPCPVEVMKKVIDRMHMREVTICYGMTETSPVSTQTRRERHLEQRTATVGTRACPTRGQDGRCCRPD